MDISSPPMPKQISGSGGGSGGGGGGGSSSSGSGGVTGMYRSQSRPQPPRLHFHSQAANNTTIPEHGPLRIATAHNAHHGNNGNTAATPAPLSSTSDLESAVRELKALDRAFEQHFPSSSASSTSAVSSSSPSLLFASGGGARTTSHNHSHTNNNNMPANTNSNTNTTNTTVATPPKVLALATSSNGSPAMVGSLSVPSLLTTTPTTTPLPTIMAVVRRTSIAQVLESRTSPRMESLGGGASGGSVTGGAVEMPMIVDPEEIGMVLAPVYVCELLDDGDQQLTPWELQHPHHHPQHAEFPSSRRPSANDFGGVGIGADHQQLQLPYGDESSSTTTTPRIGGQRKLSVTGSHVGGVSGTTTTTTMTTMTTSFQARRKSSVNSVGGGGGASSSSLSGGDHHHQNIPDIQVNLSLTASMTAGDVIVAAVRGAYGDARVDHEWGGDRGLLQRFGLFETEFLYDEEEDMSLFSAVSQPPPPPPPAAAAAATSSSSSLPSLSPSLSSLHRDHHHRDNHYHQQHASPIHKSLNLLDTASTKQELQLARRKSLSRGITVTSLQRRLHRLIGNDEVPLFLYHNWQFFKNPRKLRRTSSSGNNGSGYVGGGHRSATPMTGGGPGISALLASPSATHATATLLVDTAGVRHFNFLVRELNDEDVFLMRLGGGEKVAHREHLLHVPTTNPLDAVRNQQLKHYPVEKLYKRLLLLKKEEQRAVDDARERYSKLRAWIVSCYGQNRGYL